jgi:hypothetical protein
MFSVKNLSSRLSKEYQLVHVVFEHPFTPKNATIFGWNFKPKVVSTFLRSIEMKSHDFLWNFCQIQSTNSFIPGDGVVDVSVDELQVVQRHRQAKQRAINIGRKVRRYSHAVAEALRQDLEGKKKPIN